jgi:hypothetical protein
MKWQFDPVSRWAVFAGLFLALQPVTSIFIYFLLSLLMVVYMFYY